MSYQESTNKTIEYGRASDPSEFEYDGGLKNVGGSLAFWANMGLVTLVAAAGAAMSIVLYAASAEEADAPVSAAYLCARLPSEPARPRGTHPLATDDLCSGAPACVGSPSPLQPPLTHTQYGLGAGLTLTFFLTTVGWGAVPQPTEGAPEHLSLPIGAAYITCSKTVETVR